MQGKQWVAPVALVAILVVGAWSAQRLIHGRPRWNSLAAIGSHPANNPSKPDLGTTTAKPTSGQAERPATGAEVDPHGTGAGAGPHAIAGKDKAAGDGCPFSGEGSHAGHGKSLPPGHPLIEGATAGSLHAPHAASGHDAAKTDPHANCPLDAHAKGSGSAHGKTPASPQAAHRGAPADKPRAVLPHDGQKDPVCGMVLHPKHAPATLKHQGKEYYFCGPACRDVFKRNPGMYL